MTSIMKRVRVARSNVIWQAVCTTTGLCWGLQLATPVLATPPFSPLANRYLAQNIPGVNRFQTLVAADELYQKGQTQAAETLYRQVKPPFPPAEKRRLPITEAAQLPADGQVYWRTAQEGMGQNLAGKIFVALYRLTENYPEFIEGHLLLAKACREQPQLCSTYAREGQPKTALEILEKATDLYADEPSLLKAKIKLLQEEEQFLDASIVARQFAVIYLDDPEAPAFQQLAEENLKRHQSKLNGQLRTQGILTGILGLVDAFRKADWRTGVSGWQTLIMMGQGESQFGKAMAEKLVANYRQQDKLVEDPQVLNYVKGIAGRLTQLMGRDFEYEFYVINDSSINAFALPGGKVFVNIGAIANANSEAELAGLLSHEIAHSVLSHGFQSVASGNFLQNLSQVIPLPNILHEMVGKQFSREQEQQADILGTRVLSKAGYAADGLRNLMATLNARSGGKEQTTWRSTHPAPADRVQYLEDLIQRNGYNRYAYEGVKSHRGVQTILSGGTPDTAPPPADKPTTSKPTPPVQRGTVPLAGEQTRDRVAVQLQSAQINSARDVVITFTINNASDKKFGFVPLYAEVLTDNGKKLTARFSFDTALVSPGEQVSGQVRISGYAWTAEGSQNLNLVIKESTGGGRLFRVGF
jgi:Zn-dependent protease with chaperone function